jgi:hypothetical protein
VLFAADTVIIIINSNPADFEKNTIQICGDINVWFKDNLLTVNFDKTYFNQFLTKNRYTVDACFDYCSNQLNPATPDF